MDERFADDLELELEDEELLELRLPEELRTDEDLLEELLDELPDVLCGLEISLVSEEEEVEVERELGATRLVVARVFGDTEEDNRLLPEEDVLAMGFTSGLVGRTRVVWKPGTSLTGICCLVSSASLGLSWRLIFEGIEALLRSAVPELPDPPPVATGIFMVVCRSLTSRPSGARLAVRADEDGANEGLEVWRSAVSCSRPLDSFFVET